MGHRLATRSVDVPAPAERVWAVVADASRRPHWLPELVATDAPPGPVRPGTRFRGECRLVGHRFVGESCVLAATEGERVTEEVIIGARLRTEWSFVVLDGGGTRIEHTMEVDYPGGPLGRVERWLLGRRLRRVQAASLRALAAELAARTM